MHNVKRHLETLRLDARHMASHPRFSYAAVAYRILEYEKDSCHTLLLGKAGKGKGIKRNGEQHEYTNIKNIQKIK